MSVLRWVLFIPAAVLVSEIIRYFGRILPNGLYHLFLPETLAMVIKEGFLFIFSGTAFVVSGYIIGPNRKALVLRIVNACAITYFVAFAVLTFVLSRSGVVGSFWFPLLMSVAGVVGIAFGNGLTRPRTQISDNVVDD